MVKVVGTVYGSKDHTPRFAARQMPIEIPRLPNTAIFFSLTAYGVDLERAQDLRTLDLHHERLGSYLMALRDMGAMPNHDLRTIQELFAKVYRQQFAYLGSIGEL